MNVLVLLILVVLGWWFLSRLLGLKGCESCDASRIAGYNLPKGWRNMCDTMREGFACQKPIDCNDCEKPFRGYDTSHREIYPIYYQEWQM